MESEVSHGASVELVRQSDRIAAATAESEKAAEVQTFMQMKQLRQDAYVRWSINRHVRRVGRTQLLGEPSSARRSSKKLLEEIQSKVGRRMPAT